MRWLGDSRNQGSFYGCDVYLPAIEWCRSNIRFAEFSVTDPWPSFPYANDYFDLVYGISVLTHLDEPLQLAWLDELYRVTRKGGIVFIRIPQAFKPSSEGRLRREIALFSAIWCILSWIVTVQAYGTFMFDRYYFPMILCLSIFVPLLLHREAKEIRLRWRWDHVVAAVCTVALGWFSIAGVHDYFRWNDARWDPVRFAFSRNISPAKLAAGYEANGWENYDNYVAQNGQMAANCRVNYDDFFCVDASYRIGMNEISGYSEWRREQPSYWLAPGPPLRLLYQTDVAHPQ
jgi:SAM-dependent methyltransferase